MYLLYRMFRAPAGIFLFCAFVASLLVSLSITLPTLPGMDLVRVRLNQTGDLPGILSISNTTATEGISEIRYGVWAACYYPVNSTNRACLPSGLGYNVTVQLTNGNASTSTTVTAAWTKMLVGHPISSGVIALAVPLSFWKSTPILGMFFSVLSFIAAVATLVIDIAFSLNLRTQIKKLDSGANTHLSIGFGVWVIALAGVILAIFFLWCGRRVAARNKRLLPLAAATGKI
ncbi:hypothetical protein GALMADRAFT_142422 [Galerina marginata CBS 339.88]|uniref:Pali-domain-containing protein n=1 Tax=Galerina marginata (strain CBS 339.88) TaxID=685588 RepID=A0A067T2Q2_GALM3|nr:hypothetical protein GALMADRAFT_142422 [Galerina marginata CBS 339.88]